MSFSTSFPLITLQPVSDTRKAWVAMLLETRPSATADELGLIFRDFGLETALGGLPCIVTLPDLTAGIEALPSPQATIVRLPAAFCCDSASAPALDALQAAGYRVLADGLPARGQTPHPSVESLSLPCPGQATATGDLGWVNKLPGPHLALDADETSCPGRCHFQWFAGRLPEASHDKSPKGPESASRMVLLELLSQVVNDADAHAIEATVKRDPQLSYHLLRLVNSVAFAPTAKIASFGQAIVLLGRRQLQRWLQLLLYAHGHKDATANPLLPQAAMRAGLAEALCVRSGGSHEMQDRAFMVGMFSLLDRLFGVPLADIIGPLNLADDATQALIEGTGPLGLLLRTVTAGEKGPGDGLAAALDEARVTNEGWARSVIHACEWAIQISREA